MGPFVAVHVEPSPVDPRDLVVLLEACTSALPRGKCYADTTAESEPPAALASVRWVDEWSAHIDAHVGGTRSSALTRELTFSREDARRERFRSVGLAIATILDELRVGREPDVAPSAGTAAVDATLGASASGPPAPTEAPPPPKAPPPRAPAPHASGAADAVPSAGRGDAPLPARFGSVEVGGAVGTGLAGASARVGGYARVSHDLGAVPLYVDLRGSYALTTSNDVPSVSWLDAGVGVGAHLGVRTLRLELGIRALFDRTRATAPNPKTGSDDTAGSFTPGVGVDVRGTWPDSSRLAATVGLDSTLLVRELRITNAGQEVGHVNAYNVGVVAGARLYF